MKEIPIYRDSHKLMSLESHKASGEEVAMKHLFLIFSKRSTAKPIQAAAAAARESTAVRTRTLTEPTYE